MSPCCVHNSAHLHYIVEWCCNCNLSLNLWRASTAVEVIRSFNATANWSITSRAHQFLHGFWLFLWLPSLPCIDLPQFFDRDTMSLLPKSKTQNSWSWLTVILWGMASLLRPYFIWVSLLRSWRLLRNKKECIMYDGWSKFGRHYVCLLAIWTKKIEHMKLNIIVLACMIFCATLANDEESGKNRNLFCTTTTHPLY